MSNPGGDDYPAALAAFRQAWARLRAAIRATPDPQQRFDRATETGEMTGKLVSEAANDRTDAAIAIQDAGKLTLTDLAKRISMTKQAAGRLVARRKEHG
jgi:hypothetical protein